MRYGLRRGCARLGIFEDARAASIGIEADEPPPHDRTRLACIDQVASHKRSASESAPKPESAGKSRPETSYGGVV
jgi:hypothetical protein